MSRPPRMLRSRAARGLAGWLLAALCAAPPGLPAAQAAPEGENVVHGEASFARDGDLTVIRPSDGAIIEYKGFDILRHEAVRFEQPSEKARVLNRVSGDASRIDGALHANGIVYIVNPAGVFFGRDAVVRVGRLVAAAGELPDREFLRGVDAFALSGPLENRGSLEASAVTLLGRSVSNQGTIVAPDGVIALVAGERVLLTQLDGGISVEVDGPATGASQGIEQAGLVDAGAGAVRFAVGDHYSLAINHEGVTRGRDIEFAGGAQGLVRVSGTLDASAPEPGATGGSLRVTGERVALEDARLDASGAAGGGEIRVGGDLRGEGPLRNAQRTFVDSESVLRADALDAGDGGSVVVFAEQAAGFLGSLSARGGAEGGDGGMAELSSNGLLVDQGSEDLGAPAGVAGTLLYDPRDIVMIGGAPQDGSDAPDTQSDLLSEGGVAGRVLFGDGSDLLEPFAIHESEIEGTDANIVLEARNSIRASGTFDHDAGGEGTGVVAIRTGNDLTLRTRNEAGDETGSSVTPGIDLTGSTHGAALELRTAGDGTISMETGTGTLDGPEAPIAVGVLRTSGSDVTLTTENGSIAVAAITTSGSNGSDGTDAGDIRLDAGDQDGSGGTAVLVTGNLTARGGDGTTGTGGTGGIVALRTRPKPVAQPPPSPLPPAVGGGPVTVMGDIDVSGGDGPAGGGLGNVVVLLSAVQGDVSVGDITTRGGNALNPAAVSDGGAGGTVELSTGAGDITVGALDSSGGATDGQVEMQVVDGEPVTVPLEFGGDAGRVRILAGTEVDSPGNVLLEGRLTAQGGAGAEDGEGGGGSVEIRAGDAIEHGAFAGPHIALTGDLTLSAGTDVGASGAFEVDAGGELDSFFELEAAGPGQVNVTTPGFSDMAVRTLGPAADLDVTQGGDVVRVDGGTVTQVNTTALHTDVTVIAQDALFDRPSTPVNEDVPFDLVVATGAIVAGGNMDLQGEDDVILGDGAGIAITARLDPETADEEAGTPAHAANLGIVADRDGDDTGAIRSAGGRIDRQGDTAAPGILDLDAATGIGAPGVPILMQGGGLLAAVTRESGGIHLRNDADADAEPDELVIGEVLNTGVGVLKGPGDVVIDNTAGGLRIETGVLATGQAELGGGVTLRAATGSNIVFEPEDPRRLAVDANQALRLEGDVTLMEDTRVRSEHGDVFFQGTLDTDAARGDRVRSMIVLARAEDADATVPVTAGDIHFAGDVGIANDLRDLTLIGDVVLEGGDRRIDVTNLLALVGDVDASSDLAAGLAIQSGPRVEIIGDIGAGGRLSSFSIARNETPPFATELPDPFVLFAGDGPQQVLTGAGGISILAAGLAEVPDRAMIGKLGGDLLLESSGAGGFVNLGQNEKLTAQGNVHLVGETVHLGDISAFQLEVDSPNAFVRAREPARVLLRGGGSTRDEGTDLIADVVDFSSAPLVEGTGPAPRIGAARAVNPGELEVVSFQGGLRSSDMVTGNTVLDLVIRPVELPNEVPERGPLIEGLEMLRTSGDAASGSALAPGAEETLAFLRCSAEERDDCSVVPASPLDSPRGAQLAQEAAALLGDSGEARERRAALARLDPGALRQLAVFLTEIRLLGLSDLEYEAVRDSLYREILADRGPSAPDARAFATAVQSQARGVPL